MTLEEYARAYFRGPVVPGAVNDFIRKLRADGYRVVKLRDNGEQWVSPNTPYFLTEVLS